MGSNNQPRSFKFYRKNEAEVMKSLGLNPTKNSGSGWIEKEDGQNDYVICQLKSTDAQSMKINQKDIRMLECNAQTEHKVPVFAIQFLNTGEVWLMVKPDEIQNVSEYIKTGHTKVQWGVDISNREDLTSCVKKKIESSESSRNAFHEEKERKYKKNRSAT